MGLLEKTVVLFCRISVEKTMCKTGLVSGAISEGSGCFKKTIFFPCPKMFVFPVQKHVF